LVEVVSVEGPAMTKVLKSSLSCKKWPHSKYEAPDGTPSASERNLESHNKCGEDYFY
jgi:hypothetical protein